MYGLNAKNLLLGPKLCVRARTCVLFMPVWMHACATVCVRVNVRLWACVRVRERVLSHGMHAYRVDIAYNQYLPDILNKPPRRDKDVYFGLI